MFFFPKLHSIENGKRVIDTIFGPKFNKNFPKALKAFDDVCHGGNWPSTTNERYKDLPGIDLEVRIMEKVIVFF